MYRPNIHRGRGDFLGGLLGAVGGLLTGGPVGAVLGGIGGLTKGGGVSAGAATGVRGLVGGVMPVLRSGGSFGPTQMAQSAGSMVNAIASHNANATAPVGGSAAGTAVQTINRARGGHIVKTGVSPLGTVGVRYGRSRRMNVANIKALRRAERRIAGFVRVATKCIRWVHPGKTGHAVPKFPKRRKR